MTAAARIPARRADRFRSSSVSRTSGAVIHPPSHRRPTRRHVRSRMGGLPAGGHAYRLVVDPQTLPVRAFEYPSGLPEPFQQGVPVEAVLVAELVEIEEGAGFEAGVVAV